MKPPMEKKFVASFSWWLKCRHMFMVCNPTRKQKVRFVMEFFDAESAWLAKNWKDLRKTIYHFRFASYFQKQITLKTFSVQLISFPRLLKQKISCFWHLFEVISETKWHVFLRLTFSILYKSMPNILFFIPILSKC